MVLHAHHNNTTDSKTGAEVPFYATIQSGGWEAEAGLGHEAPSDHKTGEIEHRTSSIEHRASRIYSELETTHVVSVDSCLKLVATANATGRYMFKDCLCPTTALLLLLQ